MRRNGKRKAGAFDEHGKKIPSQHSPIAVGRRISGPRGGEPRWLPSVLATWAKVERHDADRRWRERERDREDQAAA